MARSRRIKFEVLNRMAPLIEFDLSKPGVMASFQPFQKEWENLKASGSVDRVRRINVVAFKSSQMEYFIPRAFQIVFVGIVVAFVVVLSITPLFPTKAPSGRVPQTRVR